MKYFVDENHALATGMLWGALGKGISDTHMDLTVLQLTDPRGNYEARMLVETPVGRYWVKTEPYVEPIEELLEMRSRVLDG